MTIKNCIHYWIIDAPSGSKYSKGTCVKCKEVQEFCNVLEYSTWPEPKTAKVGVELTKLGQ